MANILAGLFSAGTITPPLVYDWLDDSSEFAGESGHRADFNQPVGWVLSVAPGAETESWLFVHDLALTDGTNTASWSSLLVHTNLNDDGDEIGPIEP